jgi:hypothetical protein
VRPTAGLVTRYPAAIEIPAIPGFFPEFSSGLLLCLSAWSGAHCFSPCLIASLASYRLQLKWLLMGQIRPPL